jgi:hypothetical protein
MKKVFMTLILSLLGGSFFAGEAQALVNNVREGSNMVHDRRDARNYLIESYQYDGNLVPAYWRRNFMIPSYWNKRQDWVDSKLIGHITGESTTLNGQRESERRLPSDYYFQDSKQLQLELVERQRNVSYSNSTNYGDQWYRWWYGR